MRGHDGVVRDGLGEGANDGRLRRQRRRRWTGVARGEGGGSVSEYSKGDNRPDCIRSAARSLQRPISSLPLRSPSPSPHLSIVIHSTPSTHSVTGPTKRLAPPPRLTPSLEQEEVDSSCFVAPGDESRGRGPRVPMHLRASPHSSFLPPPLSLPLPEPIHLESRIDLPHSSAAPLQEWNYVRGKDQWRAERVGWDGRREGWGGSVKQGDLKIGRGRRGGGGRFRVFREARADEGARESRPGFRRDGGVADSARGLEKEEGAVVAAAR